MPDSAVAALRQLMGFGDNPNMAVLTAAQPSSDMMSPYMNSPDMVSNDPGMQTPAQRNVFQAGQAPTSFLPATAPLPPVRPQGLADAPAPSGDDDDPAPAAAPTGPATMPAPAAPPQPVPAAPGPAMPIAPAAQAAPQAPGTTGSSPDMMAMYEKLLDKNEKKDNFNSGMAMIAAGLSGSPETRAALLNMAAQGGAGSAQSQTMSTLQTLMQLRQFSQKQQQQGQQQDRIPAIAAKLGISVDAAKYLDASGKLDDLVLKSAEPNTEIKTLNDGRTVLINKQNAQVIQDFGGQKDEDKDPKQVALLNSMKTNWQNIPGVPDPNSTAPADQQWWRDQSTRILGGGGGVSVNVNNTPEKAEASAAGQAIGAAKGKEVADYISDGKSALAQSQLLDTMSGALHSSAGQYTGPFADYALQGKQALSGAFGIDLNTPGQEVAQKLGFQLATQASKAISARPSQAEFLRALQNVPGIFQTRQGADALISINKQEAQDRINLANLAHNVKPGENMNEIANQYYKTHPIMSPFNPGESFSQNDMNLIAGAARDNGQRGAAEFIRPTPSVAAINELKAHPEKQAAFDQHFGVGSSYHYLHGAGGQ